MALIDLHFSRDVINLVVDATAVTIDGVLKEISRQKGNLEDAIADKFTAHRAVQEQLLSDTNQRFEDVMKVIRELQRTVNQFSISGIKKTIRDLVSIDPLIPKADQFEQELKELEATLRKNEVIFLIHSLEIT